jgi:hypothetical protein
MKCMGYIYYSFALGNDNGLFLVKPTDIKRDMQISYHFLLNAYQEQNTFHSFPFLYFTLNVTEAIGSKRSIVCT